jgi:hypothetical protein
MMPYRLHLGRTLAAACVLVVAALSEASAQFPPVPGQTAQPAQHSSVFPPPPVPGQASTQQAPMQDSAFPPPPMPGQAPSPSRITVGPTQGGFSRPAPGGFGGPPPGAPSGPSEAQKVCLTFPALREDVEKGAATIKAASQRKATREEVCPLFKSFAAKEGKMVSFLETNQKLCGVPPKIVSQMKSNHAKTIQIRNNVCSAAPAGPAAPTLSDALGGPIIADDESARRPGRGTFDTLTGNVLSR